VSPAAKSGRRVPLAPALGDLAEARVAQAWFWDGYYSRRAVSLQRHYYPEPIQVTDLDLLAIDLDPMLRPRRFIGEIKTGTGRSAPKALDRIIWLRGLMELLGGVEAAELTTASRVSAQARDLGASLNVRVQSLDDLDRREKRLRIDEVDDLGSQGTTALAFARRAQAAVRREPDLERAFWVLQSEIWFLPSWMAIKRLLGLIEHVGHRWAPQVEDETQVAVRWLIAEAVGAFVLQLVVVSSAALRLDPKDYSTLVATRLADPGVDRRRMRQISEAVDRYVAGLLGQAKAPASLIAGSMGAFAPEAPAYAEALAETARRLSLRTDVARELPRYVDFVAHERLVHRREPSAAAVARLVAPEAALLARAARLAASFLSGQASLPSDVAEALGRPIAVLPESMPEERDRDVRDPGPKVTTLGPAAAIDSAKAAVSSEPRTIVKANERGAAPRPRELWDHPEEHHGDIGKEPQ
jgi:hypothetical protein